MRRSVGSMVVAGLIAAMLAMATPGAGAGPSPVALPVASVGSATVMETFARGDWVPAGVTVTLDQATTAPVSVDYTTADGTATAGGTDKDYAATSGTVTIPAGSVHGLIWVFVHGDRKAEPDEHLNVTLSDPSGATLGVSEGSVVIRDRRDPGIVITDARIVETDTATLNAKVEAIVALSERHPTAVTVDYTTTELAAWPPGGAYAGGDYLAKTGTVTIPAGALRGRIQLWTRGDTNPEIPEEFAIELTNTTTALHDPRALITIIDNDPPTPASTRRVSLASDGTQGTDVSFAPTLSSDGRYVAFASRARLESRDQNTMTDVYVQDTATGVTKRVSVSSDGTEGDYHSYGPSISSDGRHVVFTSRASNLVPDDTNNTSDVFLHDSQTGATKRVSVASDGSQAGSESQDGSISSDGRFVVFTSLARTLVPGDTNGVTDVFVHDTETSATTRASVASDGNQTSSGPGCVGVSADGRFVLFSSASRLVAGDANDTGDYFVRDTQNGTTSIVPLAVDDAQFDDRFSEGCAISGDGRFVAFSSNDSNLVSDDTNGVDDVFLHDTQTGATSRVSVAVDGTQGNDVSDAPRLSTDGRAVVFRSDASNLVPGDGNDVGDVFVRDVQAGTTVRASVSSGGAQVQLEHGYPAISGDGRFVAFVTRAANLASGDTNLVEDVFLRGPLR